MAYTAGLEGFSDHPARRWEPKRPHPGGSGRPYAPRGALEPVGPLTLRHEHSVGRTILFDRSPDLLGLLITAGAKGVSAEEAALAIIGRATDNDRKTIRRQLAKLVTGNMARKEVGKRSGHGSEGDRWYASPQATWSQREDL